MPEAVLTVKVEDDQFQKFATTFNELSDKLKTFNDRMKDLSKTMSKTSEDAQKMTNTVQNSLQTLKNMHTTVGRITEHFGKWATLIGGIGMMLGTGAGLFGIDRLARTMLQRRTQSLGMGFGADLAQMQSMQIAMTGVPGGDQVRQNIAQAQFGDINKMMVLNRLGIPTENNMTQKEILRKVLEELPKQMQHLRRDQVFQWAKARGYDQFFGMPFLMSHFGEEGKKRSQAEIAELGKEPAPMSADAMENWNKFNRAVSRFTTELENRLGEKLSGIAESLAHVSEAFTKVLAALINTPAFQSALNKIAGWLEEFAKFLEKDSTIKALQSFVQFFYDIMRPAFHLWINQISSMISIVKTLVNAATAAWEWLKDKFSGKGTEPVPPDTNDPATGLPYPIVPGKQSFVPGQNNYASLAAIRSQNLASYGGSSARISLASSGPSRTGPTMVMGGGGRSSSFFGGGGGGGRSLFNSSFGGGGGFGAGSIFARAAGRASPSNVMGLGLGILPAIIAGGGGGGRSRPMGAQDIDNWQMNRTASLVVRDVPSSNVFMSAVGMTS